MQRRTIAVWLVIIGVALGLIGTIFFYHKALGLSVPLFIFIFVLAGLATARAAQVNINLRNLWPLVPLIIFALMTAVRADELIRFLDLAAVLALGGLVLGYLARPEPLDEATVPQQTYSVIEASIFSIFGAIPEVGHSWQALRNTSWQGRTVIAVVRGLALALPILIVFALLLGAADGVFAGYLEDIWQIFSFNPSTQLIDQVVLTGALAWGVTGTLAYGINRGLAPAPSSPESEPEASEEEEEAFFAYGDEEAVAMQITAETSLPEKRKSRPLFQLGIIESGIILSLVDVLFGAFVLIQFAYFFGGEATIEARGLSFSQYARSGFFELVAVSILTLGLVLFLDYSTLRGERREQRIFRGLAVLIVALTGVMLVSAAQRMYLYEQEFGFTHLRVYTHVFMLWLGVLFIAFLLSLFRVKRHVFSLGVLLVTTGYLLMLNGMNVDLYIAQRNIDRYSEGEALDLGFLSMLSVDALPVILPLHESLAGRPEAQEWTGQWLAKELNDLDRAQQDKTIFSAHLSYDQAWSQLDAMRDSLPDYDPRFFGYGFDYGDGSRYYNIYETEETPQITPTAVAPAGD